MSTIAALRWGNVPVPYTAMWSEEAEARAPYTVMEYWDGKRLAMLCEGVNKPAGKPLFKMLHADRCREVVRNKLCQMCVQPLPETVVAVNQGQNDRMRPLLSDGLPMCPECALEAFHACPGMQRQNADGQLRIWKTRRGDWLNGPVLLGVMPVKFGGNAKVNELILSSRHPIFTGPKLVLTNWERLDVQELETYCARLSSNGQNSKLLPQSRTADVLRP